ncbi:MAG: transcription elongation factor Spt5 [DPANN group archaeon]|nr:transcription elongation factor Spt5 [DPANN group archaeon]
MGLYVIRTAIGRESQVIDFIASNAKKIKGIRSVLFPHGMTGYIIIEADAVDYIKQVAAGIPYVRGILRTPTSYDKIEHLIEFKPETIDIHKGDVVTIISGPFRGEKAKVTRVDLQKQQVVLELLQAAVPIPITLGLDSVKLAERGAEAAEEKKEESE